MPAGRRTIDARKVLEQVLADPLLARNEHLAGGRFSSRVYGDEPILKTGRQMLEEAALPPVYREARALAGGGLASRTQRDRLFFLQGMVLADAEDNCPYRGSFEQYYPTYQGMSDRQLRGYVTWRTQVRRGSVEPAPVPYAFVYVYELLNGIGVGSCEEGFSALRGFWGAWRSFDAMLDRYMRRWLCDYAVYHGLEVALVADDELLGGDIAADRALLVLADPSDRDEGERFAALAELAGYRVLGSRFYKNHPDDLMHVALAVLARLEAYYRKNRKHGLYETLFGCRATLPCELFASAVFYEPVRHSDVVYNLGPLRRYTCTRGVWTCERCSGGRGAGAKLGNVVKAVDARMRARYGFAAPLKDPPTPKYLAAIIEREIDAWISWKAAHAPRRIEIDRAKLGGIRRAAAETCEELLVDEERGEVGARGGEGAPAAQGAVAGLAGAMASETPAPEAPAAAAPAAPPPGLAAATAGDAPASGSPAPFGLTEPELALLRCLVDGLPCGDAPAGCGTTVDMLVDGINEKLFDLLGDTALEFSGGVPSVVDDYLEDVRGALLA